MDNLKSILWFAAGCSMFWPACNWFWLIDMQAQLWMFVVDLAKPNPVLLFGSFYYWPVLFALTGWYWCWRFLRWVFDDEGPLPRFFKLLVVLWAPVWVIPVTMLISTLGWLACWHRAFAVHLKEEADDTACT